MVYLSPAQPEAVYDGRAGYKHQCFSNQALLTIVKTINFL